MERRRRIKLSLWAFAYEIVGAPMVDDATFDAMAYASNRDISTGRLDIWWRLNFQPFTGQWVHQHPELDRLAKLYVDLVVRNINRTHEKCKTCGLNQSVDDPHDHTTGHHPV